MRIIHVKDLFNPEANYQINEILKETPNYNHEIFLITSNDMSYFHKKVDLVADKKFSNNYGVEIQRLKPLFKISSRMYIPFLFKKIEALKPDIVVFHGIGDFKDINLMLPKKRNYIIIRDCHMSWSASQNRFNKIYYKIFEKFLSKILNKKYDKVYSLGVEETEYLNVLGIKKEKIEDFVHGYNKRDYYFSSNEREKFRKENGISEDDIVIAYIGKLDDAKKPHINLDILKLIEEDYLQRNRIKFLFLGPQDSKYMLEKFNKKYNQIAKVHRPIILEGRKASDLREVYNGVDICLWPKQTTLSSVHAQACQSTVIMENEISNKERVIENKNLYEISNLEEAVIKIKDIIDNKKYLKEKNKWYLKKLKDREYTYQMSKKIEDWEKLVEDKRRKK